MINQLSGDYLTRDERITAYLSKTQKAISDFSKVEITQIGWNLKNYTDIVATLASTLGTNLKHYISIGALKIPRIDKRNCYIHSITVPPCWIDPYAFYLKDETLPQDKKKAEGIRRKSPRFWLSKDLNLYKRSFSGLYLMCVHLNLIQDLLFEIHEGIGNLWKSDRG